MAEVSVVHHLAGNGCPAAGPEPWHRLAFVHAPVGIAVGSTDWVVHDVNDALCHLLRRERHQVVGRRVGDFTHPEDWADEQADRNDLLAGRVDRYRRRKRYLLPDGGVVWGDLTVGLVRGPGGHPLQFVAHVADATEAHHLEVELRQHSLVDPLTDLLNRRALAQATPRLRDEATAAGEQVAVLFCDLDRFKEVNDTAGHHVGDELLRLVARRVRHAVRPQDLLARLGGDEFALVCRVAEPADALAFARRVVRCFDEPFQAGEDTFRLGVSVGVSVGPPSVEPERMLAAADTAMYSAKGTHHPVALAADWDGWAAGRAIS